MSINRRNTFIHGRTAIGVQCSNFDRPSVRQQMQLPIARIQASSDSNNRCHALIGLFVICQLSCFPDHHPNHFANVSVDLAVDAASHQTPRVHSLASSSALIRKESDRSICSADASIELVAFTKHFFLLLIDVATQCTTNSENHGSKRGINTETFNLNNKITQEHKRISSRRRATPPHPSLRIRLDKEAAKFVDLNRKKNKSPKSLFERFAKIKSVLMVLPVHQGCGKPVSASLACK